LKLDKIDISEIRNNIEAKNKSKTEEGINNKYYINV